MAIVYLDTSALVKLVVDEPGSALAAALWDGADLVVTSRLADAEVRAVLAGGRRAGRLEDDGGGDRRVGPPLAGPARRSSSRESVTTAAATLVETHPLRAADALHLASALELRSPDLVVAVWDEHLAAAARAEGLRVVP